MTQLIIANWKMNFTLPQAISFCSFLQNNYFSKELILCAPSLYLGILGEKFPKIKFAAQNVSNHKNFGQYTGQYSSSMLKTCGIKYALLGHSECRKAFHELDHEISIKAEHCLNDDLVPIICIGESMEVRDSGNYLQEIIKQLKNSLPKNIKNAREKNIIIAYEPIWSIGTGIVPNDEQLIEVFSAIDCFLKQNLFANSTVLVYGGSVNANNIARISTLNYVNGLLLGKASLDQEQLLEILNFKTKEWNND